MDKGTCILFFSRSAQSEGGFKKIHASKKLNNRLISHLHDSALKTIKSTGLPVVIWDETKQVGVNFGEKLCHAFTSCFQMGYKNVIAVGNDSPDLNERHILKAVSHLRKNNLALGKSRDGGLFLLGMKKSHFNPMAFTELQWQSNDLFNSIRDYLSRFNILWSSVGILDDLNGIRQFMSFTMREAGHWLKTIISPSPLQIGFQFDYPTVFFRLILIKNKHYKAPPHNLF